MKIAVLSDIHDRLDHLTQALKSIRTQECDRLFYLGDLCSPFTLESLAEGFNGPINAVLGNNDGDPLSLSRVESRFDHLHLHGQVAELIIEDSKYALTHYPQIAQSQALSGQFSAVFYGHTHAAESRRLPNGTLIANPGEIMGRSGKVSYGVYDSINKHFELVSLG